jgi:hypothetical protein
MEVIPRFSPRDERVARGAVNAEQRHDVAAAGLGYVFARIRVCVSLPT